MRAVEQLALIVLQKKWENVLAVVVYDMVRKTGYWGRKDHVSTRTTEITRYPMILTYNVFVE